MFKNKNPLYLNAEGFFMDTLNQNVLDELISYLKKDKYKNKIQKLKLEQCMDNDGNYIALVLIKIKKSQREKGYGSAILNDICQIADKYNVRIKLWPTDAFGAELIRLHEFYRKHGFVLIKNSDCDEFLYYPQKKIKNFVTKIN